jgi:hypothetical protein
MGVGGWGLAAELPFVVKSENERPGGDRPGLQSVLWGLDGVRPTSG